MKRAIFILINTVIFSVSLFAQNTNDFSIDRDGTITAYNGWDAAVIIPSQINGRPVTGIGSEAFRSSGITSVTIPGSIRFIGERAFIDNRLTNVSIGDDVSIADSAFSNNRIVSLIIGNDVIIANNAFSNNRLTSLTIGDGVSISNGAFTNNQLTGITIGNRASIANGSFASNQLTNLTIGDDCIIADNAFNNGRLTSVIIGNRAKIGNGAFANNRLTNLTIGNDGSIFFNAFNNNQLVTVTLGENNDFYSSAFGLSFYYDYYSNNRNAGIYNIGGNYPNRNEADYSFIETPYGAIITGYRGSEFNRLIIPRELNGKTVRGIGNEALRRLNITRVLLHDDLYFIGEMAFAGNHLTNIVIPESIVSIGSSAFSGNQLTHITIPGSITSIGSSVFSGNQLTNIFIPDNIIFIGNNAFSENQLTTVTIGDGVISIGSNTFANNRISTLIIGDGVISIGDSAFANNQLTNVTIPNNVVSVSSTSFSGNNAINSLGRFNFNRRIIIDMWDSYGDGWDGSGALRININGSNRLTTRPSISTHKEEILAAIGDQINFYWVAGSAQGENSFAVYYNDDLPNPAFNPNSSNWSQTRNDPNGKVLLFRQYNTMDNIAGGTLLGSFTVTGSSGSSSGGINKPDIELFLNQNSIEMMQIPTGTLMWGNTAITLNAFRISKYQVTQEQYEIVMGYNPSHFTAANGRLPAAGEIDTRRPVEMVTWFDAIEFCNKLSEMEGLTPTYVITGRTPATGYPITTATVTANWNSNGYRLPTEAQWEYACRAGTTTTWYFGNTESQLVNYAWYNPTSNGIGITHQVGLKQPNPWGLYDMYGNVWEWCWDWHGNYPTSNQTDYTGTVSGTWRVMRGGGWNNSGTNGANSNYRHQSSEIFYRFNSQGFRVVRP